MARTGDGRRPRVAQLPTPAPSRGAQAPAARPNKPSAELSARTRRDKAPERRPEPKNLGPRLASEVAAVNHALFMARPDLHTDEVMLPSSGVEAAASSFSDTMTIPSVADGANYYVVVSALANSVYSVTTVAAGVVTAAVNNVLTTKAAILGSATTLAHAAYGVQVAVQGVTTATLSYQGGVILRRAGTNNNTTECNTIAGLRDLLAPEPLRTAVAGQSLGEDDLIVVVDGLSQAYQPTAGPSLDPTQAAKTVTYIFQSTAAFSVIVRVYQRVGYTPTTATAPTTPIYAPAPLDPSLLAIIQGQSMRSSSTTSSTSRSLWDAAKAAAGELARQVGPGLVKGAGALLRAGARAVLPGWASWILDAQHHNAIVVRNEPNTSLRGRGAVSAEQEATLEAFIVSYPPELRMFVALAILAHVESSGELGGPAQWRVACTRMPWMTFER